MHKVPSFTSKWQFEWTMNKVGIKADNIYKIAFIIFKYLLHVKSIVISKF